MRYRLPAEWEPQSGIMLAWPHPGTDWVTSLDEAERVYTNIVSAITRFQPCVIASPTTETVRELLRRAGISSDQIYLYNVPTNDTWIRDFGPITVYDDRKPVLLDYIFNGWGLKFDSQHDNEVTNQLHKLGAFGNIECRAIDLVLEGGSIESDGQGRLLTTSDCLLNKNRNPHLGKAEIEQILSQQLGINQILWLDNGYLAGDDTDSHIDTLARLCPDNTILYQSCEDSTDEHFAALSKMHEELRGFRTRDNSPFRLIPLPWPQAQFENGQRLPATYANFLIINGAVLVPLYNDPNDPIALNAVAQAFPGREIIGIDCSTLIRQHGSLHCITMQLPEGVLL